MSCQSLERRWICRGSLCIYTNSGVESRIARPQREQEREPGDYVISILLDQLD